MLDVFGSDAGLWRAASRSLRRVSLVLLVVALLGLAVPSGFAYADDDNAHEGSRPDSSHEVESKPRTSAPASPAKVAVGPASTSRGPNVAAPQQGGPPTTREADDPPQPSPRALPNPTADPPPTRAAADPPKPSKAAPAGATRTPIPPRAADADDAPKPPPTNADAGPMPQPTSPTPPPSATGGTASTPTPTTLPAPSSSTAGSSGSAGNAVPRAAQTAPAGPKVTFVPPRPLSSVSPAAPVTTPAAPAEVLPASPRFQLGFALLKAQLGPLMGDPIEVEHGDPDTCDTLQQTTMGLAYWLCDTGTVGFAADPDGLHHWALVDGHLVEWSGLSADPPDSATDALLSTVPPPAPDATAPPACVPPNDGPDTACLLLSGMSLPGWIGESGDTSAYRFNVDDPAEQVVASLTDLPADYDLYLADSEGQLLGESVQEGTAPESVELTLPRGTYFVYVHSDSARDVDPLNPFWVRLTLSPAGAGPVAETDPDAQLAHP